MSQTMIRFVFVIFAIMLLNGYGEGIRCYHCYDSYNETLAVGSLKDDFGDKFIRCDKNKNKWNSWECPRDWPVCMVMTGRVTDHYEVIRTCAEKEFCTRYVPPVGVKLENCRECDTNFCNDYAQQPDPPVGPGPLFTFNININLNMFRTQLSTLRDKNEPNNK